jgi:hypothetical protein
MGRSAFAQTFSNFVCVCATSSAFFFSFRNFLPGQNDQPFSGKRARSSRYTCSASAERCCFINTAPSEWRTEINHPGGSSYLRASSFGLRCAVAQCRYQSFLFLRCTYMEAGQCQRQPDNDVQELCCRSYKCSPTHAKLFAESWAATAILDNCSALVGPYRSRIFPAFNNS